MNDNKTSSISALKILGCVIFDIAIIFGFYRIFGLFYIIAPGRSSLVLLFLLLGLAIFNGVILFSSTIFNRFGVPYSASLIVLTILYVLISNILSIFLINGTIIGYLVWQLILLAIYFLILALVISFTRKIDRDSARDANEQIENNLVKLYLINVETALEEKENQESISTCLSLFRSLKERINASTPFGRIIDNFTVIELEQKIKKNLLTAEEILKEELSDNNLVMFEKLLENTKRMVINRESLIVK